MKEFKIAAAVFVAVFLALVSYNLLDRYLTYKATKHALTEFNSFLKSNSQQRPLRQAQPRQQPQQASTPNPTVESNKFKPLTEEEQICNFWKDAYNNDNTDRNWQRVTEFCAEYQ